jgi:hypothetical protein
MPEDFPHAHLAAEDSANEFRHFMPGACRTDRRAVQIYCLELHRRPATEMAVLADVEVGRAFERIDEAEEYVYELPARGDA